jgi:DNA-binding NtrC family response regulator
VDTQINSARMLLVSRDPSTLNCLSTLGQANAWEMQTAHSGLEALERVQSATAPDLVLLDLLPNDTDSLHTLRWLRRVCPGVPVILLSSSENHQDMVAALHLGAQDFLLKPCEQQQLDRVLKAHLASNRRDAALAGERIERINDNLSFVTASPAMKKLRAQAELLAQVNVPVLILGEKGSGKTTTAHLIHELSVRAGTRFLKVSCDVLANDQLEKELFGYEADTVNGESSHRPGKFELCHRGTLLLEEVTEVSPSLQARIVKALQHPRVVKQKNDRMELDVRILGTSKTDAGGADKNVSGDLLSRLSAFTLYVPPLCQRREEIPILLEHFMKRLARHYGLPERRISAEALDTCRRHPWPGNLSELENFVKGYLMLGDDSLLMLREATLRQGNPCPELEETTLPQLRSLNAEQGESWTAAAPVSDTGSLKARLRSVKEETERSAIAEALGRTRWNRKAAAQLLRISYRALLYKINEYHLNPPHVSLSAPSAQDSVPPKLS